MTTASYRFDRELTRSDVYDIDEGRPINSPLLKTIPKLIPSPSPPPVIFPPQISLIPGASPGQKSTNRHRDVRTFHENQVLVAHMGDHRRPDISQFAAVQTLSAGEDSDTGSDDDTPNHARGEYPNTLHIADPLDLQGIAEAAVAFAFNQPDSVQKKTTSETTGGIGKGSQRGDHLPCEHRSLPTGEDTMVLSASSMSHVSKDLFSPLHTNSASSPRRSDMPNSVDNITSTEHRELPPLQTDDSRPDINGQGRLPSIKTQFPDLNQKRPQGPHISTTNDATLQGRATFSRSPPSLPRLSSLSNHSSPPISPNDSFRRELPSPVHSLSAAVSPFYYPSSSGSYNKPSDYRSSTHGQITEQRLPTPATSVADRMSIDGITNPAHSGGFVCNFHGCTASPFQTQYLLNSHANVHSSARPHYCSVAGCPRSESGKGFKRKNEMIRHGLVHDSPGYLCPFCPERDHKYPRPDNLQRHVKAHHVDKDKDDPLLREVLSQRPDGPNRGRRRRGGPV